MLSYKVGTQPTNGAPSHKNCFRRHWFNPQPSRQYSNTGDVRQEEFREYRHVSATRQFERTDGRNKHEHDMTTCQIIGPPQPGRTYSVHGLSGCEPHRHRLTSGRDGKRRILDACHQQALTRGRTDHLSTQCSKQVSKSINTKHVQSDNALCQLFAHVESV